MSINKQSRLRAPWTVSVARWSARHRWMVFSAWFVFTFGIFAVGQVIGLSKVELNSSSQSKIEAVKATSVLREAGEADAYADRVVMVISHPTLKVSDPQYQATVSKIAQQLRTVTYDEKGTPQPSFNQVLDYYATQSPDLASPDQSTTRLLAFVPGQRDDAKAKLEPFKTILADIKRDNPDYQIYATSRVLSNSEFSAVLEKDLNGSLFTTLPITFIILLLAFGALVAAFVPLILAITSLAAAFGILSIYSNVIAKADTSALDVVILIGLAVGIDYSLFMITRYRTERRHGRDKLAAIEAASSTAGRAVFFSGLTVMISLAGLFIVDNPGFASMAVGTIGVVLVSVIGSLTFLPATLAILGKGINWGRIPYFGRDREEGTGLWSKIVHGVMAHPIVISVTVVAVLGAAILPVTQMRIGFTSNSLEALPKSLEFRTVYTVINQKWPGQGTELTLDAVVRADAANRADVQAALQKFGDDLLKIKGLNGPLQIKPMTDARVVRLQVYMSGSSNSQANQDIVGQVRQQLVPASFGQLTGVEIYIGGNAALTRDANKVYNDALPLVLAFVLGLSFLLLLVAFHSIVIPIKAIALNLLSAGAAYGVVVLVFQEGWFAEQMGFTPVEVITNWLPVFLFTILFGLSMDYHLFILTRIKEERDRGASSNAAVAKGIGVTSATITSAAAIMVVVFAVFATSQVMEVKQLGLGLAVAVFIDAAIIRTLLLPATMKLLGDWNWWMPKFLDWLPRVQVEGPSAEPAELAEPVLASSEATPAEVVRV